MEFLSFLNQNSGALIALASSLLAIITLIYVLLTRKLVLENKKIREAQTNPRVFVIVRSHEEYINRIYLILKNIGFGTAFDIKLKIEPDFMCHIDKKYLSEYHFVKHGLKSLAPNEEFRHLLNFLQEMKEEELKTSYKVSITYNNSIGKQYKDYSMIDLSTMLDLVLAQPENKLIENLEKIQKDINTLVKKFK